MRVIFFLLLLRLTSATSLKVQRQNMKVRISAFGDTIIFKFIRPHEDSRLEGYILGYGSSMFSKQLIQLPEDGQLFETENDAEPKYLIAVQSANPDEPKKQCTGKVNLEKPLNVVIGSITETSVLLSWGTLLTTPFMDSFVDDCIDDGQFTVRYREKEPSDNWNYQTCPTTSTVIENLKPDALYEFEVRADTKTKSGVWSPPVIYNPADQITEEPFKELNQAKPEKPVLAGHPFPAVPVLKNITQTKPAPLLRHTVPPKLQKTTVFSTEADRVTTASTSPDDLPSSTQPPAFPHAPIILPTPKTTSQLSTSKPAPLTDPQYISIQQSITQQHSSTLHSTTHPPSPSTTQVSTVDQHTTKQQLITAQQQLSETSNPTPTQTNPQSTVQKHPITQDNRPTGIQPSTKPQRLKTILRSRGTFKHQTTDSYHLYSTTTFYPSSTMTLSEQKPNTKSPPRQQTIHSLPNTSLTPSTTTVIRQDDLVSKQATVTNKQSIYTINTKPFIFKEYSTHPHHTTEELPLIKSKPKPTSHPIQSPTTLWYQPQSSTTIQHSSTAVSTAKSYPDITKTAKYFPKTESQVARLLPNPTEQLPGTSKNLELKSSKSKPFTKSHAIQDSPVAEKVTVKKDRPKGQAVPSRSMDKHLSQPILKNEVANRNQGRGIYRNSTSVSRPLARNVTQRLRPNGRVSPILPTNALMHRNSTLNRKRVHSGEHHIGLWGPKPQKEPRKNHVKTKTNLVSERKEKEKVIDLKQMDPMPLKPLASPTTVKPAYQETTLSPLPSAFNGSRFDTGDNSSMFSPLPVSEIDAMGRKRFIAPHVIYKTDKRPEEPCSVTHSLSFFPDEEVGYLNVTSPPKTPISNLTVVTVEGCPSFVILDWEKSDNETTEYEVESTTKGPHGKEVSIVTTNQTHTAVENLKPESSYEFKVTPKNELGSGPTSDPVSFSTESADPRVSDIPTGKNAIWSSFPFKADSYSECNGRQFIKRTWYRKFVGIQLCNSLRYKIYLSDSLKGTFYSIGDQSGNGEDHCQFVDSFLDGRTGGPLPSDQLPPTQGFFRAVRQEPVHFGEIGGNSLINYVAWYECGIPIPGKW